VLYSTYIPSGICLIYIAIKSFNAYENIIITMSLPLFILKDDLFLMLGCVFLSPVKKLIPVLPPVKWTPAVVEFFFI
ncbi:hypothetical protein, partial [Salmonella enterica]